jgi:hypothetical protein
MSLFQNFQHLLQGVERKSKAGRKNDRERDKKE